MESGISNVLEGMGWKWRRPECGSDSGRVDGPAVEENIALRIASNEVVPFADVQHAWPAMGMKRHSLAGVDYRIEHPDRVIF